jgi:hypothetical protein
MSRFSPGRYSITANRHKSAWIWLAVAAIAVATLARAEAGLPRAAALTHPVLEFLSAHASSDGVATARHHGSRSAGLRRASQNDSAGAWTVLLPIFFIGLIAPLKLISARTLLSLGVTPSAPALASLFQRPPPPLLSSL